MKRLSIVRKALNRFLEDAGMRGDRWRQALNILLVLTQIIGGGFAAITGQGLSIDQQSALFDTRVTPAGYTFGIWGVIFLGCVVYAVFQSRSVRSGDRLLRRVGWHTAGAFLGNTAWEIECQLHGMSWLSVAIIVFTLAMSGLAFRELVRIRILLTPAESLCVLLPVGLLTGWVSVAAFANVSQALVANGANLGMTPEDLAIVLIVGAGLTGVAVTVWSHGERSYAYAVVWGLIGIAIANQTKWQNGSGAWAAWSMVGCVLAGLYADQIRAQFRPGMFRRVSQIGAIA